MKTKPTTSSVFPCTEQELLDSGLNGCVRELSYMVCSCVAGKMCADDTGIHLYFDDRDSQVMGEYIAKVENGGGDHGENEIELDEDQWIEIWFGTYPCKDGIIERDLGFSKTERKIEIG